MTASIASKRVRRRAEQAGSPRPDPARRLGTPLGEEVNGQLQQIAHIDGIQRPPNRAIMAARQGARGVQQKQEVDLWTLSESRAA
jgi:hypothetical protein